MLLLPVPEVLHGMGYLFPFSVAFIITEFHLSQEDLHNRNSMGPQGKKEQPPIPPHSSCDYPR